MSYMLKIKNNTSSKLENQVQKDINKPLFYENFQNYECFFSEVYRQMFQSLFSYGMQICGNKNLVKDCIQNLFTELWKNQKTLPKIKFIKPYLFKCLKRKIKRTLGKEKKIHIKGGFEFEMPLEVAITREEQHLRKKHLLAKALKSLPNNQREAIYLKSYSTLPYADVAKIPNIKTKAVYKLIYRALSSLKTAMTILN